MKASSDQRNGRAAQLTPREREILGLLAEGMSGVQIAAQLVLSPETVRTHVRNAMTKLGASTRSQAVALAVRERAISRRSDAGERAARGVVGRPGVSEAALERLLAHLVSLYDVEGGAVFLIDEDGLGLYRCATAPATDAGIGLPQQVALGEGGLGRAALDRRAQLVQVPRGEIGSGGMIAAPILGAGKLLGVIALLARSSRPVGRNELLLLQAFAKRLGDVIAGGNGVERKLDGVAERFRSTWLAVGGLK